MRLLAAAAAACFVYLLTGLAVGIRPTRFLRVRGARRPPTTFRLWLQQSGADVAPRQFVAISAAFGVAAACVVWWVVQVPALAVAAGLVAAAGPRAMFARRRRALLAARLAAWPDALRDLIGHLRSSLSMHVSLTELGRSGPISLRPFFERYARLSSALDHRVALEVVREELADPLSDRIIEVLLVAFDQGSSVVIDILDDLATSSGQDLRLLEEIETLQLETKLEARGAAVLPFAVLAVLCAFTPGYRTFYASAAGVVIIVVGTALSLAGLVMISRLGRVPTEERILAAGGER